MRFTAIVSTVIMSLVTGPFIFLEGFRASIPLLIALVCGIIWTCIAD